MISATATAAASAVGPPSYHGSYTPSHPGRRPSWHSQRFNRFPRNQGTLSSFSISQSTHLPPLTFSTQAAAPREIAFYQHLSTITRPTTYSPTEDIEVSSPSSEALFAFKRYVPKFLGTLQIQGQLVDEEVKPVVSKGHSEVKFSLSTPLYPSSGD